MNCPNCHEKHNVKEEDFNVHICEEDNEIELIYTCPECGFESIVGTSIKEFKDEFKEDW